MFLVFPATVGLVVLAAPIISLLYERGAFDATDRMATAGALQAYGYGLLFYAGLKVLQPAFYAIDKRWFPMIASLIALVVNIGCNYTFVFVFKWGHESLALTTSIVASLNFLFLYAAMTRYAGDVGTRGIVVSFFKIGAATAVMAALCLAANRYVFADLGGMGFVMKSLWLGCVVGIAAGAYFAVAKLLRVDEVGEILSIVKRKTGR